MLRRDAMRGHGEARLPPCRNARLARCSRRGAFRGPGDWAAAVEDCASRARHRIADDGKIDFVGMSDLADDDRAVMKSNARLEGESEVHLQIRVHMLRGGEHP